MQEEQKASSGNEIRNSIGGSQPKLVQKNSYSYAFKQQILRAWQPVPTLGSTVTIFIAFGLIFLGLGLAMYLLTKQVWNLELRYDNQCSTIGANCTVTFTVLAQVTGPIYVYYELNNFYQNYRRFLNSMDYRQLDGQVLTASDVSSTCEGAVYMSDIGRTESWGGFNLASDAVANPCGLLARSVFNDTYLLYDANNNPISINEQNIAWKADIAHKYQRAPNSEMIQWIDPTNEHFIVWMRTAASPNFLKLWGRIEQNLSPGTYSFTVANNFDVTSFDGSKYIYLSTANIFGGTNSFLAIAYIVIGGASLFFALLFVVNRKFTKSKFLKVMREEKRE